MTGPLVVQLVGDGSDGRWQMWRWSDPQLPGGVHEVPNIGAVAAWLSDTLPQSGRLRIDGPLTRPSDEAQLMQRLSKALLPPVLVEQLLTARADGVALHVRVMPSRPAASVPWGLLSVGSGLRLLDIADVSWVAPILPRDVAQVPQPRATWQEVCSKAPLRVIDPVTDLGSVLGSDVELCTCHGRSGSAARGQEFTWQDLSTGLRSAPSRLLLVGHCISNARTGDTAFMLSGSSVEDRWDKGSLFAADLLHGTLTPGSHGRPGGELWPIPPRAAIVACASGVDLSAREPFGIATALLMNGADTVQATLWTLPTDVALSQHDPNAVGAFPSLVRAIDHAQSCDDPVAALCDWQRVRLAAWREAPSLATSPMLWGSVMTMTAPDRRIAAPTQTELPRRP